MSLFAEKLRVTNVFTHKMKLTQSIIYLMLLVSFLLLLTSCSKKVIVDKADVEPKVEIAPLQPTNKPIENQN